MEASSRNSLREERKASTVALSRAFRFSGRSTTRTATCPSSRSTRTGDFSVMSRSQGREDTKERRNTVSEATASSIWVAFQQGSDAAPAAGSRVDRYSVLEVRAVKGAVSDDCAFEPGRGT